MKENKIKQVQISNEKLSRLTPRLPEIRISDSALAEMQAYEIAIEGFGDAWERTIAALAVGHVKGDNGGTTGLLCDGDLPDIRLTYLCSDETIVITSVHEDGDQGSLFGSGPNLRDDRTVEPKPPRPWPAADLITQTKARQVRKVAKASGYGNVRVVPRHYYPGYDYVFLVDKALPGGQMSLFLLRKSLDDLLRARCHVLLGSSLDRAIAARISRSSISIE